jgi:hypothetical protein
MKVDMSDETVPKRQYTEEFRLEAVRLVDSVGGHEAARRLGIPIATLSKPDLCLISATLPSGSALLRRNRYGYSPKYRPLILVVY